MTGPRDFEVISDVISGQLALPSRHLLPAELEQQAYDLSIVPPTDGLFQIRGVPRAANHAASSDVYFCKRGGWAVGGWLPKLAKSVLRGMKAEDRRLFVQERQFSGSPPGVFSAVSGAARRSALAYVCSNSKLERTSF